MQQEPGELARVDRRDDLDCEREQGRVGAQGAGLESSVEGGVAGGIDRIVICGAGMGTTWRSAVCTFAVCRCHSPEDSLPVPEAGEERCDTSSDPGSVLPCLLSATCLATPLCQALSFHLPEGNQRRSPATGQKLHRDTIDLSLPRPVPNGSMIPAFFLLARPASTTTTSTSSNHLLMENRVGTVWPAGRIHYQALVSVFYLTSVPLLAVCLSRRTLLSVAGCHPREGS